MTSSKQPAFRKYVLVPAPTPVASQSDEESKKAARHAEEIKSLRHYNPTLDALATLRLQIESVFTRQDLGDADKLALIHSIQNRFDALKPSAMGLSVATQAPPPAAPAAAAPPPAAPAAAPPAAAAPPPAAPASAPPAEVAPPPVAAAAAATTTTASTESKTLPAMYDRKIARFDREILKQYPNRIGVDYGSGELMIDGKRIINSNYADLMRELYIHNKAHNLIGLDALTTTISSLLPTTSISINHLISNSKIIEQIDPEAKEPSSETASSSVHPYSSALDTFRSKKLHNLKHNVKYQDAQDNSLIEPPPPPPPPPALPPGQAPKTLRIYK